MGLIEMLRRQVVLPAGVRMLERADPGRVGGYRLTGRVGAGGMGVVYTGLASDGRQVAVKVIRAEYAADPGFRARFAREVELMARVRNPSIAAVLDADTGAARPWLVTEYVPGPTLDQQVREHGPLAAGRVRTLALGVAEALAAVHAAGIVHRDLKPANVVLSPDGPKVLDFGIARAADETSLTRTGVLVGSSGWISPEQYRGEDPGTAADLFALGALLAFAATGRPPFGTGTAEAVAFRVLQDEPDLSPVPEELRGLVTRCLAKDPADRPSASELVDALAGQWSPEDALAPTAVLTRLITEEWDGSALHSPASPPITYTPPRTASRTRVYLVSTGAGIALAAAVIAGTAFALRSAPPPAAPVPQAASNTPGSETPSVSAAPVASKKPSAQPSRPRTAAQFADASVKAMAEQKTAAFTHRREVTQAVSGNANGRFAFTPDRSTDYDMTVGCQDEVTSQTHQEHLVIVGDEGHMSSGETDAYIPIDVTAHERYEYCPANLSALVRWGSSPYNIPVLLKTATGVEHSRSAGRTILRGSLPTAELVGGNPVAPLYEFFLNAPRTHFTVHLDGQYLPRLLEIHCPIDFGSERMEGTLITTYDRWGQVPSVTWP